MYTSVKSPYYINRPISATFNNFRNKDYNNKTTTIKKPNELKIREIKFNKTVKGNLFNKKAEPSLTKLFKNLWKNNKNWIKNKKIYNGLIALDREKKLIRNNLIIKSYKPNKFHNSNKYFNNKMSKEGYSRNKLGTFYYR